MGDRRPRLREARWEDIPGIALLVQSHFEEFQDVPVKEVAALCCYRWWENPACGPEHVLGWVLEGGAGEIVGFLGLVPMQFKVGTYELPAASGTTWVVTPVYRAQSVDLYKQYMAWGDRHLLLDTTAGEVASKFHAALKLGMQRIPLDTMQDRLLWLLKPEALLAWRLRKSSRATALSTLVERQPLALVSKLVLRLAYLRRRRIAFAAASLSVEEVHAFTDEFDRLWEDQRAYYGITLVRRKEFLNWRHFATPNGRARSHVLACRHNGALVGYAAVRARCTPTAAPGHFVLVDLFFDRGRPEAFYSLMNAAFRVVRTRGGSIFEVAGYHPWIMRELKTQRPLVLKTRTWTYWYKAPTEELRALCQREPWWPSGIDGDLNM